MSDSVAEAQAEPAWLLLGLGFATGMEFYIADSMNLVLPDIAGALGVSQDEASWLLTTYSCTLFLGVPVCIWLAGHLGYKRYLIGTVILFALASIGCALAPDLNVMLAFRALEGFAGAGLLVWWRASIYLLLTKPQRSPSLMRVSTVLYLSSALGLLASGWITDNLNWRLIFLPIVLYAIAAIFVLARHFPDVPRPQTARLVRTDTLGILLLAIAVITLQIVLSRGPVDDWLGSPRLRLLAWTSLLTLAGFIAWQACAANRTPLLDISLLANRAVLSSAVLGVFTGIILSGSLYALPEYLRNIDPRHLSAGQTAQVMCVYALAAAAIRPLMVEAIARLGQRLAILFALCCLIASMLWFSRVLTSDTPDSAYLAPLILYACCLAPMLPAVGSGTVARIDQGHLLDGVSLYMTFRQFGASLGVASLNALIDARETTHSTRLFDHVRGNLPETDTIVQRLGETVIARSGTSGVQAHHMAIGLLDQNAVTQAATLAYADAFIAMAAVGAVTLLALPLIPATPPTKPLFAPWSTRVGPAPR
jgi:MFS transporter, DHA2 family, multidrug resistance protein